MNNYFNYIYLQITRWLQLLAIPMALLTVIIGAIFFRPVNTFWEIPVIHLQKICRPQTNDDLKNCDVYEVLVWAGGDHSKIRIRAKTASHMIMNALWANKKADTESTKKLISARIYNASQLFSPGSDGLDTYLKQGMNSLTISETYSSSYSIEEEDVTYTDKGFWIYTAKLTILWDNGRLGTQKKEISIRWIPTRKELRNKTGKAILASTMHLRESK